MARVAIVGAGVVGVASAWALCRAGHEVTLIDRNAAPAQGVSRANGAQLSYAYGDALGSPSLLRHLPAILLRQDPAYRLQFQPDPEMLIWGLRFLANCLPGRFLANSRDLLQMAAASAAVLQGVMDEFGPAFDRAFDHAPSGKMILYGTEAACAAGARLRAVKEELGIRQEVLDRAAATAIEPALDLYPDAIARVVYSPGDAAGRPDAFCAGLVAGLQRRYGLQAWFGQEVLGLRSHNGRIAGLTFAARAPLDCDMVVVATGQVPGFLPRKERPFARVWPVQGYSLTARATPAAMRVSITDLGRKIVFARLGDEVRIAGLADVGPRRPKFDAARFDSFRQAAAEAFGPAFVSGADGAAGWSGARPCTPSSRPVVQAGRLRGLFLNIGHGTLGWTLCLGSAQRLMQVIGEDP